MTESADVDVSKPLAGEVTLYQKPTYTVVKFLLQNPRENSVLVTMRQTLPDDVDETQVTFAEEYNGSAWELEDGELRFQMQLAGEELVETAYGTRDISLETLKQQIRVSTITITDETGEQLGTVTGLQPTVAEKSDKTAGDETDDEEKTVTKNDAEQEGADETEEKEETDESAGTETPDEGLTDTENGQSAAKQESSEGEQRESEIDQQAEMTAESDDESDDAFDEQEKDEPKSGDEDDAVSAEEVTADLPANRSDYILEDVKDRIESADEFDWQQVGDEPKRSGGVIGWVKSIFGR